MRHMPNCRWERTLPVECEYRATHHYCPHPEHACDCPPAATPLPDTAPPAGSSSDTTGAAATIYHRLNPMMVGQTARRYRTDLAIPAERAIRDAMFAVEEAGAHRLLTDAVNLLSDALEKVADWYENRSRPKHVCGLQGFGRGYDGLTDVCPACSAAAPVAGTPTAAPPETLDLDAIQKRCEAVASYSHITNGTQILIDEDIPALLSAVSRLQRERASLEFRLEEANAVEKLLQTYQNSLAAEEVTVADLRSRLASVERENARLTAEAEASREVIEAAQDVMDLPENRGDSHEETWHRLASALMAARSTPTPATKETEK